MDKLVANTVDAAQEKHVPVVEKIEGGYLVKLKFHRFFGKFQVARKLKF